MLKWTFTLQRNIFTLTVNSAAACMYVPSFLCTYHCSIWPLGMKRRRYTGLCSPPLHVTVMGVWLANHQAPMWSHGRSEWHASPYLEVACIFLAPGSQAEKQDRKEKVRTYYWQGCGYSVLAAISCTRKAFKASLLGVKINRCQLKHTDKSSILNV